MRFLRQKSQGLELLARSVQKLNNFEINHGLHEAWSWSRDYSLVGLKHSGKLETPRQPRFWASQSWIFSIKWYLGKVWMGLLHNHTGLFNLVQSIRNFVRWWQMVLQSLQVALKCIEKDGNLSLSRVPYPPSQTFFSLEIFLLLKQKDHRAYWFPNRGIRYEWFYPRQHWNWN